MVQSFKLRGWFFRSVFLAKYPEPSIISSLSRRVLQSWAGIRQMRICNSAFLLSLKLLAVLLFLLARGKCLAVSRRWALHTTFCSFSLQQGKLKRREPPDYSKLPSRFHATLSSFFHQSKAKKRKKNRASVCLTEKLEAGKDPELFDCRNTK